MNQVHPRLPLSADELQKFCRKWQMSEVALFGSAVREDFQPDSDLDVMVAFTPDAEIGLWDLVRIQRELEELVGRRVDLVEKGTIENPYRQAAIDRDLTVIYAA